MVQVLGLENKAITLMPIAFQNIAVTSFSGKDDGWNLPKLRI